MDVAKKAIPTHLTIRRRKAIFVLAHGRMAYLFYLLHEHLNKRKPIPRHISILTGAMWMEEMMNNSNESSFYNNIGMRMLTFLKLQHLLESHGVLEDSRHVSSTEKLGILVYMLITGLSNRKLQELFQRSASTISITINQLVKDITAHKALICMFITLPGNNVSAAEEITSNPQFLPYFDDCIGAVDGSHIPVFNILAVCNFNMEFTYMMLGWEGSAHDGRLWDAARSSSLKIPDGKWLLGDAGLGCPGWHKVTGFRPQNYQELYNLRHLSAQNVIERIFGVVKKRFKVFVTGCHYDTKIQVQVIILMTFLHSFIRVNNPKDESSLDQHIEELGTHQPVTMEYGELHHTVITRVKLTRASSKREKISKKMWDDYQHHLQYCQRHRHGRTAAL
ncbi:uncharacterized protein VP01_51g5 [Puccinia sorghi]|uniref:Uncharacterized protein n=1 Tax=Puccinia sorghi TaxID=27349 RepID=A0A0L6UMP3_9BASI|nr:uncharacterized protein VP01_51g5 [Puccinia sorghi]